MYTVFSKPQCPWCDRAKALLKSKNLPFEEEIIDIGQPKEDGKKYVSVEEFKALTGASTLPQILLNDHPIGGFNQLMQYVGGA